MIASDHSALSSMAPFQWYTLTVPGVAATHAASRASTSPRAMRRASFSEPQVLRTTILSVIV